MTAIHVPNLSSIAHDDHLLRSAFTDATTAVPRFPSTRAVWAGRTLSGLAVVFLLIDAANKILRLPVAVEATIQLGYSPNVVRGIGIVGLVCLATYVVPRTAILGAVLWTGYLGGAIATQVRVGNPLFSHTLFPIYVAVLIWGGLWLRDARLRACVRTSFANRAPGSTRTRQGASDA